MRRARGAFTIRECPMLAEGIAKGGQIVLALEFDVASRRDLSFVATVETQTEQSVTA